MKMKLMAALVVGAVCSVTALSAATGGAGNPASTGFTAGQTFTHLLNRDVKSNNGEDLGRLGDVVVDLASGRVLYAVVSSGSQNYTVPATLFAEPRGNNPLVASTDKQHLTSALTTPSQADPKLGSMDFVNQVYQHYGQKPWWQNYGTPTGRTFDTAQKGSHLIRMTVQDQKNQTLGTISDVVIDMKDSRAPFLLMNAPNIAKSGQVIPMPPMALTVSADKNHLNTGVDKAKLQSAPQIQAGTMTQLNNPQFAANVYQFYGKQTYWNQ